MAVIQLTRTHRVLIGIVVAGAVIIAAIGFAGSYAAVRELAEAKGFGQFSLVFPIGIDAGICVLLALDLLLTWMRIPFPLLRQTAWLLTAATIAFNGAASWPDPLGTAMHAVIPVLFVVSVEAARHAVGRIADITADKHMEGVRLTRWLLSPVPTFKLWRRMKLWELRSYEQVIKLEQERLIYQARLQARFGRNWRRKAPVESMMPLRLAKYGVPLAETAPAGLAAAGIEEPEHVTVERVDAGSESVLSIGRQRAGEWADDAQQPAAAAAEVLVGGKAEAVREISAAQRPVPVLPDLDYVAAAEAFIQQRGGFPDARQFALFLALYDITDPTTGGPLPAPLLEPVVDELRLQYRAPEPVTERLQHETGSEDPMGSRPAEPDPQSEAAPVGERAPGRTAGTSAWFGSDQDAPSGSAPQATLEEVESWNEATRDNAPEEQRASSNSDSNAAVGAGAASGGATADRTGQGRRVVQIRIPEPNGGDRTPAHTPPGDGVGEPARKPVEPVEEEAPVHEERALSGAEVVAARYWELPAEERARSANALAPLLAEGTDYTVGTVRKYLGDIKRSEKQTAVRH
ncbi:hypothetical protein STAN_7035 [Streptomyces sp. CBMAI 2042]|uniref:DUF2637 domain-containing protein n=1 Tax=Streptomyces sp. CBMAI 2042 TaxID=2305222 RepID=UPI000F0E096A|nr:DUF2637 domain-containing protein [Streptomyces sp. CBMAI 2042]RLV64215.1 hypothetical protein STAN_7035 [Streptomyces sp. CBMAI 2042]